jgi:hypothetical protein
VNPSHFLILGGLCAAGALGGYGARRLAPGGTSSSAVAEPSAKTGATGARSIDGGPAAVAALPEIPHRKSEDTVETLLASDPQSLYARLAAWMIDASEEDIAAYWSGYQNGKRTNDITDLVFIQWTRLNPRGAIAATAGGKDEHYAWWAWASHDPKGALAAALAENPDRVNNVTWGIGEFDPEWLRENFDKIPEAARGNALRGMAKWTDAQDPEGSLDFMREHDMQFHKETFLSLVRKDPWAAQDWLKRNPGLSRGYYSSGESPQDLLISTMARERPEDLERLAALTPPGAEKRKMEQKLFDQLADSDPEAALEQARAGDVPILAAQQLGLIGMKLLRSDPDQAFALAAEMLEKSGGKLGFETKVQYGNGSTSWGQEGDKAQQFLDMLSTKDRERTLALATDGAKQNNPLRQVFQNLASQWANSDLVGFTNWTNRQTDPDVRATAAYQISSQLVQQEHFEEAMDWASMDPNHGNSFMSVLYQWAHKDREAAVGWLDAADLPEKDKAMHRKNFERIDP